MGREIMWVKQILNIYDAIPSTSNLSTQLNARKSVAFEMGTISVDVSIPIAF